MIQGVINKVFERKFGNSKFYSIGLRGVDGFFGTGAKRPPAEGTYVRFDSRTNAKGYFEVDGAIEVVADQEAAPAASVGQAAGASAKSGGGGQSAYWDRKEARDITNDANRELGASRNTALAIIDLAIKNEIIKLPAAAKREEFIWTLLDKYTKKLMGTTEEAKLEDLERPGDLVPASPDVGDGDSWN